MTRDNRDYDKPSGVAPSGIPAIPFWIQACVIAGVLLFTIGGVLAIVNPGMMLAPREPITQGVLIYARYLVSRNLAIALFLLIALLLKSRTQLGLLLLLAGCIQLFDAVLDLKDGRWMLVPGVSVLAFLFLFTAARVSGIPFWKAAAWRSS